MERTSSDQAHHQCRSGGSQRPGRLLAVPRRRLARSRSAARHRASRALRRSASRGRLVSVPPAACPSPACKGAKHGSERCGWSGRHQAKQAGTVHPVRRALSSIIDSFDVEALTISALPRLCLSEVSRENFRPRVAENETTTGFSPRTGTVEAVHLRWSPTHPLMQSLDDLGWLASLASGTVGEHIVARGHHQRESGATALARAGQRKL